MKKLRNEIIILLFIVNSINAQPSMGIQGGLNFSEFNGTFFGGTTPNQRLIVLIGGIPFEFRLGNSIAIQPELNYISKGGVNKTNFGHGNFNKVSYKFNYIEVPVLFKFSHLESIVSFNLYAGPSIGYCISANTKFTDSSNGITLSKTKKLNFQEDHINRTDLSWNIGTGISFFRGLNKYFINFLYKQGMSNMKREDQTTTPNDESVKNNNFVFNFGILSPLSSKKPKQPELPSK